MANTSLSIEKPEKDRKGFYLRLDTIEMIETERKKLDCTGAKFIEALVDDYVERQGEKG